MADKVTKEWLEQHPESTLQLGDGLPKEGESILKKVELKKGDIVVDAETMKEVLERLQKQDIEIEEMKGKNAGLEELFSADKGVEPTGEKKLRERKSYEPAFRTVRLRKYPLGGDIEKMHYVIGWTNRGAYEKVDRTGVSPTVVNYLDVLFLDEETMQPMRTTKDGKEVLLAESVPVKDLLNQGVAVNCKIIERKMETKKVPTGEEINVTVFDPAHGLMQTGEVIDGYVGVTDITYTLQIPGLTKHLVIDGKYVN